MPGDGPEDAFPPAPPTPPGLLCPRCGGNRWRVWETRPRKWRLERTRRCKGCGLQVRTSERVAGKSPRPAAEGSRGGRQFKDRAAGDDPPPAA